MKSIEILISRKGIYTFVAIAIIILGAIVVNAVKPNPGHTLSEVQGALCKSNGVDCNFFTEAVGDDAYITKIDIDNDFKDIGGLCNWDGWNIPDSEVCPIWEELAPGDEIGDDLSTYQGYLGGDVDPECRVPIGECTSFFDGEDSGCVLSHPSRKSISDYGIRSYCQAGIITQEIAVDYNCRLISDGNCPPIV